MTSQTLHTSDNTTRRCDLHQWVSARSQQRQMTEQPVSCQQPFFVLDCKVTTIINYIATVKESLKSVHICLSNHKKTEWVLYFVQCTVVLTYLSAQNAKQNAWKAHLYAESKWNVKTFKAMLVIEPVTLSHLFGMWHLSNRGYMTYSKSGINARIRIGLMACKNTSIWLWIEHKVII